jgi:monothiol glutaredoxin
MTSEIFKAIRQDIDANPILLYMKGTPELPSCGFSHFVCQVLNKLGVSFTSRNVLDDMELRQEIKAFSDWPTIPQLYIKGEFIGGCDIVKDAYESGQLETLLRNQGLLKS